MEYSVVSKSCKRCGGDLFLEQDAFNSYYACIQCSAIDENYTKLLRIRLHNHWRDVEEKEKGKHALFPAVR